MTFSNIVGEYVPGHVLSLNERYYIAKKREYTPMPHPVVEELNRHGDLHTVVRQEARFVDQVGTMSSPS